MNIYENYISELLNEDKPIGAKNRELWLNYLEKRYMSRDDIEALDRSPFRTVLRMHETLVRNLYKKYPDIFGRVHKEVLEE